MTDEEFKRAREICEKAEDGPWDHEVHESDHRGTGIIWSLDRNVEKGSFSSPTKMIVAEIPYNSNDLKPWHGMKDDLFEHTASFIAESRSLLPQALDEIERLKEELKWYKGAFFAANGSTLTSTIPEDTL